MTDAEKPESEEVKEPEASEAKVLPLDEAKDALEPEAQAKNTMETAPVNEVPEAAAPVVPPPIQEVPSAVAEIEEKPAELPVVEPEAPILAESTELPPIEPDIPASIETEEPDPGHSPDPESEIPEPEPVQAAAPGKAHKLDLIQVIRETPPTPETFDRKKLKAHTRRDFLIYSAGVVAAASGLWWLLPSDTQTAHLTMAQQAWLDSLETRISPRLAKRSDAVKSKFLDRVLTFDDDVAAALFSPTRSVPTYSVDMITPNLRNNYDGQTPDPGYIDTWKLELTGLASGKTEKLPISLLLSRFPRHQEITRLVCVEGWSAIAGWGGLRFADLLAAYPPKPGARWAKLISDVNLDGDGNPDPYYVSIDLTTAIHPQALLATHHNGKPLELEHGAPVRLVVPMKLGLKNIKAVTRIEYSVHQPADYWNDRGYSKYDGV